MPTLTNEARMDNPVMVLPDTLKGLLTAHKAAMRSGLPEEVAYLVHLRASQINGCSQCTDMHARELKHSGASDEKLWAVSAWRESPHFSADERAALALTEALTRISDRPDAVTDEVFDEAARRFGPDQLSALIIEIGLINTWNRINVAVRQPVTPV